MNLRNRLGLHFAACAAVAVAGSASAEVVWSGIVNLNVPSTVDGLYLNVITGANNLGGGGGSGVPGWDVNAWSDFGLQWFSPTGGGYVRGLGSSGFSVDNLGFGTLIDASQSFGGGSSETTGTSAFNLNSSENLVGFRFVNEATGLTHYGWLRLELAGSLQAQPRAVVEYAFESEAGVGILAGTIPAPGAVALLGLAGLAGSRRRRG